MYCNLTLGRYLRYLTYHWPFDPNAAEYISQYLIERDAHHLSGMAPKSNKKTIHHCCAHQPKRRPVQYPVAPNLHPQKHGSPLVRAKSTCPALPRQKLGSSESTRHGVIPPKPYLYHPPLKIYIISPASVFQVLLLQIPLFFSRFVFSLPAHTPFDLPHSPQDLSKAIDGLHRESKRHRQD